MGHSLIAFIIVIGILVFIHEFGHFIAARIMGVGVDVFSLGFGPKILKKTMGRTQYCLSAIPLGGYVKMVGEDPEEEVQPTDIQRSFSHQGLVKRMAIEAAGPLFNLLLAVVIFLVIFISYGVPVLTTRVGGVEPNSPAFRSGVQQGDRIVGVDGREVKKWEELSSQIKESQGRSLKFRLQRDSQELEIAVQPIRKEGKNIFGERQENWAIGIASEVAIEKGDSLLAVGQAFSKTGEYSMLTLVALYKMVKGDVSPKTLGGPLLIAQMAGQQAREGLGSFFFFVAILSINLGVLNLLPIPVLDGGHLLFFLLEGILGRPVKLKHRERAQQVGIFVLIMIMIYAFYNDIARFFER